MKNSIFHLVSVQLLDLFNFNKVIHSHDKKEKVKAAFLAGLIVFLGVVFALYSTMAAYGYALIGLPELILPIMMMAASIAILFTSIFKTNGVLFASKDYDLLCALPIKPSVVVASRFITLYVLNLVFTLLIMLPSAAVYCVFTAPPILFYLYFVISLIFVPLFPMLIAVLIGVILMLISLKFKHTTMISTILNIVLFVGIFAGSAMLGNVDFTKIGDMSTQLLNVVYRTYPPAMIYSAAVVDMNLFAFLGFVLCSLGIFLIIIYVISACYSKINTALTTHFAKSNYKLTQLSSQTPFKALYIKEFRRLGASSLYVMNTSVGLILAVMMSVAVCVIGADKLDKMLMIPGAAQLIARIFPLAVALVLCMMTTTCSAISLEGSSIFIIMSAPISVKTIMDSKLMVSLTLMLPSSLICSICGVIAFGGDLQSIIAMFIIPIVYCYFISYAGLFLNLKFPNFTWKNEVVIIKQSAPVVLSMLVGLLFVGIPIAAVLMLGSSYSNLILSLTAVIILLVSLWLRRFVNNFKLKSIV